jgi:surface protein
MFSYARSFNQPINDWYVSNVTDMNLMFSGACNFNQSIDKWDLSKVKDMSGMFNNCPIEDKNKPASWKNDDGYPSDNSERYYSDDWCYYD